MKMPLITAATYITLVRFLLLPPFIYAVLHDYLSAAAATGMIALLSDILDGYIARHYHQESALGALLDPLADKLFILSAFTLIWWRYAGLIPTWFIIFLWLKELLILIGAALLVLRNHQPVHARMSGKIAFFVQAAYCFLLFFTRYTKTDATSFLSSILVLIVMTTLYALIDYGNVGYHIFSKPSTVHKV
jgi:cardiolipin synthase